MKDTSFQADAVLRKYRIEIERRRTCRYKKECWIFKKKELSFAESVSRKGEGCII